MVASPEQVPRVEPSTSDQRVRLHGVSWSDYDRMLAIRGEQRLPRITYVEGELELMSPSLEHELIKSLLGQLVELFADERGIDLWPVGSWTVRSATAARGLEPDECYCVGDPHGKDAPDLAIEVQWSIGTLDKLDIYRGLAVGEVWIWREGTITVHLLERDGYRIAPASRLLPGLDLALLAELATRAPSEARRALRAAIRG